MRVNAGPLPDDHWLHDPEDGGGRLLGEGCHFVDLLATLAGSSRSVRACARRSAAGAADRVQRQSLRRRSASHGAVANLVYSGGGDTRLPKERLEVFGGGSPRCSTTSDASTVHRGGKRRDWKSAAGQGPPREIARFLAAARGEASHRQWRRT